MAFLESSGMGGSRTTITTDPTDRSDHSNPQQGANAKKVPTHMETTASSVSTASLTGADRASPSCEADDRSAISCPWSSPDVVERSRVGKERSSSRPPPVSNINDCRKLFVGGLPKDVTATEFFIFFAQFGKVMDSFIVYDKSTGKPRGFGFVTFEDPAVCQTLLQMQAVNASKSSSSSFDEDLEEHSDSLSSPSKLMMRGRLIEMKIAQPREAETKKWQPMQQPTYQLPNHHHHHLHQQQQQHHHPYWGNDNGMYDYVTKYPATLPQHSYGMYDAPPMTPIPPSNPMMTPATPAQAVLDMAHHMLFYAQLLATPSLSTANYEPMLAPPHCESPRCDMPFDYHYRRHEPSLPTMHESSATTTLLPPLPDVLVSPSKRPKEAFQIGGATFYPDLPSSPPTSPEDTTRITSQKKRIVTSL